MERTGANSSGPNGVNSSGANGVNVKCSSLKRSGTQGAGFACARFKGVQAAVTRARMNPS